MSKRNENTEKISKEKKVRIKTYYLTLSQVFPKDLPNAGKPTGFETAFLAVQQHKGNADKFCTHPKYHTIRANYDFWRKRFEKIAAGEACLSIRQWVGKPYAKGSTQREIARLTREDGIGIQKMTVAGITAWHPIFVNGNAVNTEDLANNDGLDKVDWCNWFAGYDLTKPLAVIHFTKYRY